jgi:hypothetical protein
MVLAVRRRAMLDLLDADHALVLVHGEDRAPVPELDPLLPVGVSPHDAHAAHFGPILETRQLFRHGVLDVSRQVFERSLGFAGPEDLVLSALRSWRRRWRFGPFLPLFVLLRPELAPRVSRELHGAILPHVDSLVKGGYHFGVDEFIPQKALQKALSSKLDLEVRQEIVQTGPFAFRCLIPLPRVQEVFKYAYHDNLAWPSRMPIPIVTYHRGRDEWRIMDGMMRICAAKDAGFTQIPALVASGETFEALEEILKLGYYGEDFVEMLAMVSPLVLENIEQRDESRMSGR